MTKPTYKQKKPFINDALPENVQTLIEYLNHAVDEDFFPIAHLFTDIQKICDDALNIQLTASEDRLYKRLAIERIRRLSMASHCFAYDAVGLLGSYTEDITKENHAMQRACKADDFPSNNLPC